MAEITFNDQNFEAEVLKSDVPVLVDFWAPWCGPCRMQGPIVEELATDYNGKAVKIGKLNVDEAPQSSSAFNIKSIPTLMVFKNGEPVEQFIGVQEKSVLAEALNKHIA
jgi:thioredoxin 1